MDEREAELWSTLVRGQMATKIIKDASAEMRAKIKFYEEGIEEYLVACSRLQAENEWYSKEIARVEAETERLKAETERLKASASASASAAGGRDGSSRRKRRWGGEGRRGRAGRRAAAS